MGRSVSSPIGTQASAIRDVSGMGYEFDEDGNRDYDSEFDQLSCQFEWDAFKEWIVEQGQELFPSMEDVSSENKWAGNEDLVLLENKFAQIGVSEYCGCANIWLRSREDDYNDYYPDEQKIMNLCENWCNRVHDNFMKKFAEFVRVGGFSDGTSCYERVA